jgi:PAS domain S-box-containing protein
MNVTHLSRYLGIYFIFVLGLLILSLGTLYSNPSRGGNSRILILHSYHQGYYWTDEINKGIFKTLGSQRNVDIHVEYMDLIRNTSTNHIQLLTELYKHKYTDNNLKFDAIIVSDDHAFNYLLENRTKLFFDAPVVFLGVDDFSYSRIENIRNIRGVNVKPSIRETVETALNLTPEAKRLAVISGTRLTEKIFLKHFIDALPHFDEKVEILYFSEMEQDELISALKELQPDDIVLYLSWLQTPSGKTFSVSEALGIITSATSNRIFGIRDFTLSYGVIGGKVVHAFSHGETAALMATDIPNGMKPNGAPMIVESPNRFVFNGSLLKKHNISEKYLPNNSFIIKRDSDYLIDYWDEIVKNSFFGYDLFENHGSVMLLIEPGSGTIIDGNRAAFNYYGYPDLIGKNISEINTLSIEEIEQEMARARRLSQNYFEFRHRLANDEIRDVEVYSYPVLIGDHDVLFSMVLDVTAMNEAQLKAKRANNFILASAMAGLIVLSIFVLLLLKNIKSRIVAEKGLSESEKRYRELFNNVLDIVFSCDPMGTIININKAAYNVMGATRIIGRNVSEFITEDMLVKTRLYLMKVLKNRNSSFTLETQLINKKGEASYYEVNGYVKYNAKGKPVEIFGIARNIDMQKEINKNILKTVINTEERERRRFAAELHDGIGPLLSGLKMYLQQDSLAENLSTRQVKILSYSRQLVDDAINQTRTIANNLTPAILNDFGLEKALCSFINKVNALGVCEVKFEASRGLENITSNESLVVYRVVTELINNALKYASCTEIIINIEVYGNTLLLFYSDNGIGFDILPKL